MKVICLKQVTVRTVKETTPAVADSGDRNHSPFSPLSMDN